MFSLLEFKSICFDNARKAIHFFDNDYGVSVIQSDYSHGGSEGLYELAVLKFVNGCYRLCYDTPITSDVVGYLSESDVSEIMEIISGY